MALHLHDLRKQYVSPDGAAVPVIDVESFSLGTGEQVALVGGSGTGKTTLLHLIAGILTPDGGQILFADDDGQPAAVPAGAAAVAAPAGTPETGQTGQVVLEYRSPETPAAPAAGRGVDITKLSEAGRDVFRGRYVGYIFQTHHLLPGFTA